MRMKRLAITCQLAAVLVGCQDQQNGFPATAKPQKAAASKVPPSPAIPPVASRDTALPAKASEQQVSPPQPIGPPKYPTLAQVLAAAGLKPQADVIEDLDHQITSYGTLQDDRDAYLIAYYWSLPSGTLEDPLRVLSFNRKNAEWKSAQLMLGSENCNCP